MSQLKKKTILLIKSFFLMSQLKKNDFTNKIVFSNEPVKKKTILLIKSFFLMSQLKKNDFTNKSFF